MSLRRKTRTVCTHDNSLLILYFLHIRHIAEVLFFVILNPSITTKGKAIGGACRRALFGLTGAFIELDLVELSTSLSIDGVDSSALLDFV